MGKTVTAGVETEQVAQDLERLATAIENPGFDRETRLVFFGLRRPIPIKIGECREAIVDDVISVEDALGILNKAQDILAGLAHAGS